MIQLQKTFHSLVRTVLVPLLLTSVTVVVAQPGDVGGDRDRSGGSQSFESPEFSSPDRPAPSYNGGNLGGPSMGGEAVNAGSGGNPGREGNAGSGGNPGREGGSRLGANTGESSIGGLESRFGARGNGAIPINFDPENGDLSSWVANFQRGGFGSMIRRNAEASDDTLDAIDRDDRLPDGFDGTAAPGAFDDLSALDEAIEVNNEVQNAVQDAAEQASDAVNETANNATQAAQNAYDAFWNDYYAAVDATADAYYDAATAVADYYFNVYIDAVHYTTAAVDYYLAYAAQYADYCAVYPFDCYSYSYDYSTNTYYYTGDLSTEPAGTTEVGTVTADLSLDTAEPMPSADAYEAVVLFANDHLAAAVEPLYAGSATPEMQELLMRLPDQLSAHLLNSTVVADETYWALLNGGIAGVMVGDCTDGECQVTEENLSMLLSTESIGAYGLVANTAFPPSTSGALQLITDVYPKLEGLVFSELSDVEGYAYTATTAGLGYDAATRSSVSVPKVIYTGVARVDDKPFVYVLVAVGETFSAQVS